MINITVYHNSIDDASKAAVALLEFIKTQIDTRIVGRQPYSSLLPVAPNLRQFAAQLVFVDACCPTPTCSTSKALRQSFERAGFPAKVALVIHHHDDPVSAGTAEFIRWRLNRLLNPHDLPIAVGGESPLVPPCLPILTDITVNYYCDRVESATDTTMIVKAPTQCVVGKIVPAVELDHSDYLALYGCRPPVIRNYLQHPMDLNKSVWVSLTQKDPGWLLCASQFNQTSYGNQSRGLLLTQAQAERFLATYNSSTLSIASGDTPIDLFYEMLYLHLLEA